MSTAGRSNETDENLKKKTVSKNAEGLIQFEEGDKDIFVRWPSKLEAHSHKIHIVNGKKVHNEQIHVAEYSINKKEHGLVNGSAFYIQVTISKKDGGVIMCHKADYTVGGDEVVTNCYATLCLKRPYDTIDVVWRPPKREPINYRLALFKIQKPVPLPVKLAIVPENKATFSDLDQKTMYCFTIKPVYGPNETGKESRSNDITTAAVPETLLLPTKVECFLDPKNTSRQIIARWEKPEAGDIDYYECRLYHKQHPEHRVDVQKTELTSANFRCLKAEKIYYVGVRVVYKDGKETDVVFSKSVSTAPVIDNRIEKSETFGKPDKISHSIKERTMTRVTMSLSWSPVHVGANYILIRYDIDVKLQSSGLNPNTWGQNKIFSTKCEPGNTTIENIENIKPGNTYQAKVTTIMEDLDTLEILQIPETYEFHTDASTTEIYDCTWREGIVKFLWAPVNGAKTYTLIVKELFGEQVLHESQNAAKDCGKESKGSGKCQKKVQMTNKLGIGRGCRVKILVVAEGDLKSETAWKIQLIGGPDVARNVKAFECKEDPTRSINVTFDLPKEGLPDLYKVIARPKSGRLKTSYFQSNNGVFENLRMGMEYTFEVYAVYGKIAREPCISNQCSTHGGNTSDPLLKIAGNGGTVDIRDSTFAGSITRLNIAKDANFGKVRDLRAEVAPSGEVDLVTIHWKVPAFDLNPKGYKVLRYKVDIKSEIDNKFHSSELLYKKGKFSYTTSEYTFELGVTYCVSVTTFYEDIDQDVDNSSSAAKMTVHSRPCKPVMLPHVYGDDQIKIEWNDAKGATSYAVEIFTENSRRPLYETNTMKETFWIRKFSETFGYGTCFHAVITAVGQENKRNSIKSAQETIGYKVNETMNAPARIEKARIILTDSGIGTIDSKSFATKQSGESHIMSTYMRMTTVKGSLPEKMSTDENAIINESMNPAQDQNMLKMQPDEACGSKNHLLEYIEWLSHHEHRKDRITTWLEGSPASGQVTQPPTKDEIAIGEAKYGISGSISTCIDRLSLTGLNPTVETLKIFSACLETLGLVVNQLDLSHNTLLGDEKLSRMVDVVRHSSVKSLILQNCRLNPTNMTTLRKLLADKMLTKLDLSGNPDLGPDGFALLGNVVSNCKITTLVIKQCEIMQEHVVRLREKLAGAKLFEVDVSGNTNLGEGGITELSRLGQDSETKSLIMKNCDLMPNTVKLLSTLHLTKLDVSENTNLGCGGMAHIGDFVKRSKVETLVLRDCMLSTDHIKTFKQSLDGFKLVELDISRKKEPAEALSVFKSHSTVRSDDTGACTGQQGTNTTQPEDSLSSEQRNTQTKLLSQDDSGRDDTTLQEEEFGNDESSNASTDLQEQPEFHPEDMIMHLLPNVVKRIKMENWNIEKKGRKILTDEMRKRKLPSLQVTFGTSSTQGFPTLSIDELPSQAVQNNQPEQQFVKDFQRSKEKVDSSSIESGNEFQDISLDDIRESEPETENKEDSSEDSKWDVGDEDSTAHAGDKGEDEGKKPCSAGVESKNCETSHGSFSGKLIGPEGGEIELFGCKLSFPQGALLEETWMELSIDSDLQQIPENYVAVTPILKCKPSIMFHKLVSAEMRTCFSASVGKEVPVTVLYKKQKVQEWKRQAEACLKEKNVIFFKLSHFCRKVGVVAEESCVDGYCHLLHDVYIHRKWATIICVLSKDKAIQKDRRLDLKQKNYVEVDCPTEEVILAVGEKISMRLECTKPPGIEISASASTVEINTIFMKRKNFHQVYFELELAKEYCGTTRMKYFLPIDGEDKTIPLIFDWPIKETQDKQSQKTDEACKGGINVSITSHDTANNMVRGSGQIDVKQEGTTNIAGKPD